MGDATSNNESIFLQNYNISNVDILKIGHHGSKTSSTAAFIDKIHPKALGCILSIKAAVELVLLP